MARKSLAKGDSALEKTPLKSHIASKRRENGSVPSLESKFGNDETDTSVLTKSTIEPNDGISGECNLEQQSDCAPSLTMSCLNSNSEVTLEMNFTENMGEKIRARTNYKGDIKFSRSDESMIRPSKRRRRSVQGTPSVSDSSDERADQVQTSLHLNQEKSLEKEKPADVCEYDQGKIELIDLTCYDRKREELKLDRHLKTDQKSCIPPKDDQLVSVAPLANLSNENPTQQSTHEADSTLEYPSSPSKEMQHRVQRVDSYIENRRLLINQLIKCREIAQRSLDTLSKQTLEEERMLFQRSISEASTRKRVGSVSPNPSTHQKASKRSSTRRIPSSKQKIHINQDDLNTEVNDGLITIETGLTVDCPIALASSLPIDRNVNVQTFPKTKTNEHEIPTLPSITVQKSVDLKREHHSSLPGSKRLPLSNKSLGKRSLPTGRGKRKSLPNSTSTESSNLVIVSGVHEQSTQVVAKGMRVKYKCPEFVALRARRAVIMRQLASFGCASLDSNSISQHTPLHFTPDFHQNSNPLQTKSTQLKRNIPFPPFRLPSRRKTHWDTVMEELRWLATDFIEERKWKMSSARTLSSAIATHQKNLQIIRQNQKSTSDPSSYDLKCAKVIAKFLSSSVILHWSAIAGQGIQANDGFPLWKNYFEMKEEFYNDLHGLSAVNMGSLKSTPSINCGSTPEKQGNHIEPTTSKPPSSCAASVAPQNGTEADRVENTNCNANNIRKSGDKLRCTSVDHSSRTEIIERYLAVLAGMVIECGHGTLPDFYSIHSNENTSGISLSPAQVKAIQWVNRIWELDPSPANLHVKGTGAILTGGSGSGKTLAICFWLAKMRKDGPQLVICAPGNLIRWKHELSKFPDIRAIVFGYDSWSDVCEYEELRSNMSQSYSKLKDGDVVICELDSLNDKIHYKFLSSFLWGSIILDCRFSDPSFSPGSCVAPLQLESYSWWRSALKLRCSSHTPHRRLLIDSNRKFLGKRPERAEKNSRIVAFLLPTVFNSSATHVMRWANKHMYEKIGSSNTENGSRILLQKIVERFTISTDECDSANIHSDYLLSESCFDEISAENGAIGISVKVQQNSEENSSRKAIWATRLCYMDTQQKESYFRHCCWLKGALSSRTTKIAAEALLKLRELCLHNDIKKIMNSYGPHWWSIYRSGAGSPNVDTAQSIVDGSSKMKELLRILIQEAKSESRVKVLESDGFFSLSRLNFSRYNQEDLNLARHTLRNTLSIKRDSSERKNNEFANLRNEIAHGKYKKKVLILASLPEALIMVHILLNSCGITHNLLTNFNPTAFHPSQDSHDVKQFSRYSKMANWVEAQSIFARFDQKFPGQGARPQCDILVANPAVVGSATGGLSAGAADIVVSVDEDWSRQGAPYLESIVKFCELHHSGCTGSNFQLIKLICGDTCEESFFNSLETLCLNITDDAPTNVDGGSVEEIYSGKVDVPRHISRLRNQCLSDVLKQPLPPIFFTGKQAVFLPRQQETNSSSVKTIFDDESFEKELITLENAKLSYMHHLHPLKLCYTCTELPSGVVNRRDLCSFPTRLYCLQQSMIRCSDKKVESDTTFRTFETEAEYERELADAWQRAGLGCSTGDQTETLLFYRTESPKEFDDISELRRRPSHLLGGCNLYVSCFASTRTKHHDGYCMREPLVYAPPFFPCPDDTDPLQDRSEFQNNHETKNSCETNAPLASFDAAVGGGILGDVMSLDMDLDLIPDIDASNIPGDPSTSLSDKFLDKSPFLDVFGDMNGMKPNESLEGDKVIDALPVDYPLIMMPDSSLCSPKAKSLLPLNSSSSLQGNSNQGIIGSGLFFDEKQTEIVDRSTYCNSSVTETGFYRSWCNIDFCSHDYEDYLTSKDIHLESVLLYVNRPTLATIQGKGGFTKKLKRKLSSTYANDQGNSTLLLAQRNGEHQGERSHRTIKGEESLKYFQIQEKVQDRVQKKNGLLIIGNGSLKNNSSKMNASPVPLFRGKELKLSIGSSQDRFSSNLSESDTFMYTAIPGISLPKGITLSQYEENSEGSPWSKEDDEILKAAALRYECSCLLPYT
jgi:hypothetical protein